MMQMQDYNVQDTGFSMDLSVSRDNMPLEISTREINIQKVLTNYEYWNRNSGFMSSNNYDNSEFRKIVEMGEEAVPGIIKIIQDHPDPIVHALDIIYPGYMTYNGYVSLEDVCRTWIITLTALGKV